MKEPEINTTVSADADAAAAAAKAEADAKAAEPDAKALAEENATLKRTLADRERVIGEKDQAVQYWHGQAKGAKPAAAENKQAEPEDTTDLLDLIGTKGAKGLNEYLKANGFVKATDVDAAVNAKAGEIARESGVVGKFPELKDKTSEFFKTTAKHFVALEADGIKGARATELAANMAYAEMLEAGTIKPKAGKAAEAEAAAEREAERLKRVKAQEGDTGRRTAAPSGKDDELDATQKRMCEAFGIDEAAYIKRAKEGVQYART